MKYIIYFLLFACCSMVSCNGDDEPTIVVPPKNDETYLPKNVRPVLDTWQQKTFSFFYEGACPTTGMAYEGTERGNILTTGGSGFGLMALIVGCERNWISRNDAAKQIQKIVRFLGSAERFKGVWSHWYTPDGKSAPFGDQVKTGDIVETGFLTAGLLTVSEYFTSDNVIEKEIRDSVASFWKTINWRHYTNNQNVLKWLWHSQENRFDLDVQGWNEAWITYLLALAAPEPHNISENVYDNGWKQNNAIYYPYREFYGYKLPLGEEYGGPLFFSHYSFLGLDPRKIEDEHVNYWHQNTAHTLINRHYCIEKAPANFKYDEKNWGLTACYGVSGLEYKARSPLNDDGVIAPTAALSAYPYTPFYSTQVLLHLAAQDFVAGKYGFADAYFPATNEAEKNNLAIDQGPIVVMVENYRSGLIWKLLMNNSHIRQGLSKAGVKEKPDFSDGFHRVVINTMTNEYDMMRHPDRGKFELDFYIVNAGNTTFTIENLKNEKIYTETVVAVSGENVFTFDSDKIMNGESYTITMKTSADKEFTLKTRLR